MSRQIILVPQGAEYQAVCRGVRRGTEVQPAIVAIPIGAPAVSRFLQAWQQPIDRILVVGLCGSLTTAYGVGDAVVYRECVSPLNPPKMGDFEAGEGPPELEGWGTGESLARLTTIACDPTSTTNLHQKLNLPIVRAVTSDRVIHLAAEKRAIAESTQAAVVDMEGMAVLQHFASRAVPVAMLRVVSDDCQRDLPDLSEAFSPEGQLLAGKLTIALLSRPIAASRLVRGSLKGLSVLEKLAQQVVQD